MTSANPSTAKASAKTMTTGLMFAFSMPALMTGFMHAPELQIQGVYAKTAGIPLAAMAAALLLTRLLDAFTYPLIGYLSDLTFKKFGTRKPWILAGTAVTVTGLWFLYHPGADVGITWFTIWMSVAYVGWKLTEIPYIAWSYSVTHDYVERQSVQTWRAVALLVGNMLFFVVPYAAKGLGLTDDSSLNFQTLGLAAGVIVLVVPLVNLISLARVPEGDAPLPAPPQRSGSRTDQLRELGRALRGNKPLVQFLSCLVVLQALIAMSSGVQFLFIDVYLHLGEKLPLISLAALPSSLLGLPLWGWLCLKYERHRVWAVSSGLVAVCYLVLGFVPIGSGALPFILTIYPVAIFCVIAIAVAAPAIMGDIRDYDLLQSGKDRAGIYAAIMAFTGKSLLGIGGAAGLALAGWFGFDAAATTQSSAATFGIRFTAMWLPAIGFAISVPMLWNFPIDRKCQAEIAAALKAKEAAAAAANAAT